MFILLKPFYYAFKKNVYVKIYILNILKPFSFKQAFSIVSRFNHVH